MKTRFWRTMWRPPTVVSNTSVVATDDIVPFNAVSKEYVVAKVTALEKALHDYDIEKHAGKDITGCTSGTVIGIDLYDGL